MELGNNWAWDNTVSAVYDVEAQDFSAGFETELNYTLDNGVKMYASTSFDLRDAEFTGMNVGMEYEVGSPDVTMGAWVALDSNLEYENAFISVSWDF